MASLYFLWTIIVILLITEMGSGLPAMRFDDNYNDSDYGGISSGDYDMDMFDMRKMSYVNNRFALDLYQSIAGDSIEENIFFSPMSILNSLALTYLGTSGNTSRQLSEVIGFGQMGDSQIHRSVHDLNEVILTTLTSACTLRSVNRIFVMEHASVREQFIADARVYYNATAKNLDFVSGRQTARQEINTWVRGQTQGKIKNLIGRNELNAMTALVLVNAVYYKADWEQKFKKKLTRASLFHTENNVSVQVPMMHQIGRFPYGFDSVCQCDIIELPYSGRQVSMVIVLPRSPETTIASLESQLTPESFQRWSMIMQIDQKVDVYLPKFTLNEDLRLDSVLKRMGVTDLFDIHKADLSGVCNNSTLYVSKANHQACIDVDEDGSEATAATSVIMTGRSGGTEININRPFLFFIRHNPTDTVLFLGRLMKPSKRMSENYNKKDSPNQLAAARRAPPLAGRRSRVGRLYEHPNKI